MNTRFRAILPVVAFFTLLLVTPTLVHAGPPQWVQLSPANSPSARYSPAMAYDPVSRQIVLFGGKSGSGLLNDTWLFDGTNWTKVQTATAPLPRYNAGFAYDKGSKKLVLFGGQSLNTDFSDTWLWDGATETWTQATPLHSPPPLGGTMAFTDPRSGHAMLFGGLLQQGGYVDTTYRWNGTSWQLLNLSPRPQARTMGAISFDNKTRTVVLFSGLPEPDTNNTWVWDGTSWTQKFPPTQPPQTNFPSAGYDAGLRSVVVFGGLNGFPQNETWLWDGSTWNDATPSQAPSPRSRAGMAYDPAIGRLILFGGTPDIGQFLSDTWELEP
jgi:hypothetical protein